MKVADAIARVLVAEGVEFLVCYPRQLLIDPCIDAGLKPVICRQERVGVGLADRISPSTGGGQIGGLSMQRGPGHREFLSRRGAGLWRQRAGAADAGRRQCRPRLHAADLQRGR